MIRGAEQLGRLARIARVKADGELRAYSACRAQAEAMQRQLDAVRAELAQAIAAPTAPDAPAEWRQTAAMVGYRAEQLRQAEIALARIRPGLDAARRRHKVTWHWVRGHAGHPQNERADELARLAMTPFRKTKRSLPAAS